MKRASAGFRVRRIRSLLCVAGLFSALGCDTGSLSAPAPAACVEAAMQCQLPEGPLGVCERSACAPGAAPPCFQCVPQH